MKKFLSAIMTAVMVLAMSLQVFAAPSIVGSIDKGQVEFSQGSGKWDTFERENYTEQIQNLVDRINSSGAGVSVLDSFGEDSSLLSDIVVYDKDSNSKELDFYLPGKLYYLSPMLELTFDDVTPTLDNPVSVTFTANNMTEDMDVYVLYYCPEHGAWELLETERTSDNQVTASFHAGSSLCALVYLPKGASADTAEGVSPKTGDNDYAMMLTIAALGLVIFGLYAVRKSRKASF